MKIVASQINMKNQKCSCKAAKLSSWDEVAKGTNWDQSRRCDELAIVGNFLIPEEPSQKKRKPSRLKDINKLKVPLFPEIPMTDLTIFEEVLGKVSFGTFSENVLKESQFHIIMELVNGHTLQDVIFKQNIRNKYNLTLEEKYIIALKMCKAIIFLHQHPLKVLHRDIEPGNVMLTLKDKDVKVCDLGLAKFNEINSQLRSTIGCSTPESPLFMAPEVYLLKQTTSQFTDVRALAATITELSSGHPLWKCNGGRARFNLTNLMMNGEMPSLLDVPISL
ncbi:hypothetical protein TSAR_010388 [Trichomalopsis sarcophagae]|uniref:Protein kinase domain-containing protein n=1 Tax=Trichomalopsis sarcophagae TaxID=543379 RepID=A0A232EJX8_9HYME|nr:hypothetical protein TSAR_010388 [Trichomalopsis sarcophagae]